MEMIPCEKNFMVKEQFFSPWEGVKVGSSESFFPVNAKIRK